jgi:hypothetical protein
MTTDVTQSLYVIFSHLANADKVDLNGPNVIF